MSDADVVVIGAGIAGLAAALSASRAGARVTVIDGGAGGTALSGGAWDVASPRAAWGPPRALAAALQSLPREHPLSRVPAHRVRAAHDALLDALAIYRPLGEHADAALVATELALPRRAATAQRAVLDLGPHPRARVAIAWMRALRSFDGPFVAASLNERAVRAGDPRRFVAMELELLRRAGDAVLLPHELAALLDHDDARRRLVTTLTRALGGASFDAVLVPPLLGLEDDRVPALVEAGVGLPVGEVVESLAGAQALRLARRITAALEAMSIPRVEGRVRRIELDDARVVLADGAELRAGAVVLATGKHVGGGITSASHDVREPLAGLPLYARGRPLPLVSSARGRDPCALYGDDFFTPGAGLTLGVGCDTSMRALDPHGAPTSLFVCGALLAGAHVADGTGMGLAATTGWIAGASAAAA